MECNAFVPKCVVVVKGELWIVQIILEEITAVVGDTGCVSLTLQSFKRSNIASDGARKRPVIFHISMSSHGEGTQIHINSDHSH